jgi:hypothetical protein
MMFARNLNQDQALTSEKFRQLDKEMTCWVLTKKSSEFSHQLTPSFCPISVVLAGLHFR